MATLHASRPTRGASPRAEQRELALAHPIRPLLVAWAFLLALSAGQDIAAALGLVGDRVWMLDVEVESSFYTWFSVLLLAAAALLTGLVALERKAAGDPLRIHWMLLAAVFLLLSADEACSVHEALSGRLTSGLGTSGAFHFAWIIPAGILSGLGLLAFIPFIRAFPSGLRALLLLSAALFLSGAIGMEMLAGAIGAASDEVLHSGRYRVLATLEEALEGGAVILYLAVVFEMRRRESPAITLRLG